MLRASVPAMVALVVLLGAGGPAMAETASISSPTNNEEYDTEASIACSGSSTYSSGVLTVKLKKGSAVVDSANADVNSEGDWSCQFDPGDDGWATGEYIVYVYRGEEQKAWVRIKVTEVI